MGSINRGLFSATCPLVTETDLYDGCKLTGGTDELDCSSDISRLDFFFFLYRPPHPCNIWCIDVFVTIHNLSVIYIYSTPGHSSLWGTELSMPEVHLNHVGAQDGGFLLVLHHLAWHIRMWGRCSISPSFPCDGIPWWCLKPSTPEK